ncbi:MAG: tRNA dihydrouridine synthase DusB [Clostridiales bacterium]|nr:tRNA dihydrouridine synthase DusB [Clostridiales bacterium]
MEGNAVKTNKPALKIGEVFFDNPFVLAPMAGITDKSMRSLCIQQGASFAYTEMVSGKGLWYGDKKSRKLLEYESFEEGRIGYQLFGSAPEIMAFAAKTLRDDGNLLLDLNVGCPVPKIVRNGEGSALLKNLDRLYDVVKVMVKEAGKPVTAKIRMGFVRGENTAVETARALESAGAAAVTVHGRTREQFYEGKADWQVIADVKKSLGIPVIGNGDVRCGTDAIHIMEQTGCDGVMIARGALGNPWIFREAAALWRGEEPPPPPTSDEKIDMLLKHLDLVTKDKGAHVAVCEIRKHVGWYIKGLHGAAVLRREVNGITDIDEMKRTLIECRNG